MSSNIDSPGATLAPVVSDLEQVYLLLQQSERLRDALGLKGKIELSVDAGMWTINVEHYDETGVDGPDLLSTLRTFIAQMRENYSNRVQQAEARAVQMREAFQALEAL